MNASAITHCQFRFLIRISVTVFKWELLKRSTLTAFIFLLSIFSGVGAESAFAPKHVSEEPGFVLPSTLGNSFVFIPPLPSTISLQITRIGIYDGNGDGLENAHSIAVWGEGYTLLGSGVIPAGTKGEFVDGYRYIDIPTITVQPQGRFIIGALYQSGDSDLAVRPDSIAASTSSIFIWPSGLTSGQVQNSELTVPTHEISRFMEGVPNFSFYPVNFQFEIIPEPSTLCLFALGLGGVLWGKRFRPRRQSGSQ